MRWIRDEYANPDSPFFMKSYSEKERAEASSHKYPVVYLSTRFAGKEAVIKCIDIGESIRLNEIEITASENGKPTVVLSGPVRRIAEGKGIKYLNISLSHDGGYAIAFAIAEY